MKTTMKRIALICLCLTMMFMSCIGVNATHMSSWSYSPTCCPNYGARVVVETPANVYATTEINSAGKTYDIMLYVLACVDHPQIVSEYGYVPMETEKYLEEEFPANVPNPYYRNVTSLESDEVVVFEEATLMHSYADSFAYLSNFEKNDDGEYIFDIVFVFSHEIADVDNHDSSECYICLYYAN